MPTDRNDLGKHAARLCALSFKIGTYRPPSEGGSASLLLRVTENCPWNQCTFCDMYNGQRFVYRPVEEIKADIDTFAAIRDEISAASWTRGMRGGIGRELGGRERRRQHAENSARVLSAINPHYIRSRPLVPRPGTPMFDDVAQGRMHLSSPHERLEELAWMIADLDVSSRVCFDHAMNAWSDRSGALLLRQDYEGYRFPEEKPLLMERIRDGPRDRRIDARPCPKTDGRAGPLKGHRNAVNGCAWMWSRQKSIC